MPKILQFLACPARVCADFHCYFAGRNARELLLEGFSRGGQTRFFNQFTLLVKESNKRILISEIDSDKNCAIVRHGTVPPFAPKSALIVGNIFHKMEPVFEGPAFSY
jgi:hypothetical protein